jgi:SAM-dependent methyltransferase
MAISTIQYYIIRELFQGGFVPQNGALLEIGEANWYNDIDPLAMAEDVKRFVTEPVRRDALVQRIAELANSEDQEWQFHIAKVYYELFFAPSEIQAIDFGGTAIAKKLDLNMPVVLDRRFDVVINHGTAEHIFDIAQVFRTIHDYTAPGGMMIHESPFTGWIDHGFYTLQPTLFFDLAEANQYSILGIFITQINDKSIVRLRDRATLYGLIKAKQIPDNANLFTVLRKYTEHRPFQIPQQGYYRESLPESGMAAWRELR